VTVIACRDGIVAADSRVTYESEAGGTRVSKCFKLYRKAGDIIALSGETAPGLVFLDWYGTKKAAPSVLIDGEADFQALVLTKQGMFEYDKWCRGEKMRHGKFWSSGCGAKAALGAMHAGASARQAVAIACKIDPFCAPPIVWMKL
jgi:hypothetical protein